MTTARLILLIAASTAFAAGGAQAEDAGQAVPTGFYGGLSLRYGPGNPGVDFSSVSSAWVKFASATAAGSGGSAALVYGGYRISRDISIEAAVARSDALALTFDRPGMGLALSPFADSASQRWNADFYTSYNVGHAFSLYGRVGYRESDPLPAYLPQFASAVPRNLEGVNYGVGLRYDMTPALGLKLEYARFGRLAFDSFSGAFPDSDQVQIGVQYRF